MKYETLKTNVAYYIYNQGQRDTNVDWNEIAIKVNLRSMIQEGKRTKTVELIKELKDKVWDAIMLIDIRCIKTLVEIAPKAVPAWIKSGNYYLDMTDEGWEVIKSSTE